VIGRLALTVLALGLLGGCGEVSGEVVSGSFRASADRVDVSSLAPGTYTFLASNDDPTGLDDGIGPDTDTRTIVVR
jgi:hypothetical protein